MKNDGLFKNAYIGVDDVDGRKIHEGDFVYLTMPNPMKPGQWVKFKCRVVFINGCFAFQKYDNPKTCIIAYGVVRGKWKLETLTVEED